MDGNGRWARPRGLPRIEGHRRGVASVRRDHGALCPAAASSQLTLYCLSSENWRRPATELRFLMHLLEQYMIEERALLMRQRIRLSMIGRRDGPAAGDARRARPHRGALRRATTACGCAWRSTTARGRRSSTRPGGSPGTSSPAASTRRRSTRTRSPRGSTRPGMPDPDLLIRTAGEMRISNFLLWQISYAELWVTTGRMARVRPSGISTRRWPRSPAATDGSEGSRPS